MNRRYLIRLLALTSVASVCGCAVHSIRRFIPILNKEEELDGSQDIGEVQAPASPQVQMGPEEATEALLKDMRARSAYFAQDFPDDIYFRDRKFELLQSLVHKFRAVQRHVGHGHFNLLGMDEFFRLSRYAAGSSEVTSEEKNFLEEIFYFDAKNYGFQGDKVMHKMTDIIPQSSVVKVPYTGHYLRKGPSLETYNKIKKDVGDSIILTSGVRGIAKQYHLFFEKGLETKGNMSKASRSLAPPGYSFHGLEDFDVGRRGFGLNNFTDQFATTEEYKKLVNLGYIEIRYTQNNLLGVRFEPWHIKVG